MHARGFFSLYSDLCHFSLGLGATINVAKPPKGSTVAIFGLGAVGLAVSVEIICLLYALSIAVRMCVGFASDTLHICIIY